MLLLVRRVAVRGDGGEGLCAAGPPEKFRTSTIVLSQLETVLGVRRRREESLRKTMKKESEDVRKRLEDESEIEDDADDVSSSAGFAALSDDDNVCFTAARCSSRARRLSPALRRIGPPFGRSVIPMLRGKS